MKREHSTKEIWVSGSALPHARKSPHSGQQTRRQSHAQPPSQQHSRISNAAPHRKNAARQNRSESPYQQRTSQKDNPTQQLIKQAVDYLIQQLEAGKSETLTAYLGAMARFHSYSFGNILQIARQRPTATQRSGHSRMERAGPVCEEGREGHPDSRADHRPPAQERRRQSRSRTTKPAPMLIGFRAVYVFDLSQTEGADLPEFEHNITGEVGEHRDRMIAFLAQQNIALEFNEKIAPALGVTYGGKIALLPGQSKAEEFTTLVHETAHELLHKAERRTMTTATVRETEAEAVAFIVGQAVGLEMGTASSDYIQMYAGNAALLAESLEVIQRTSAVILAAIQADEPTQENEAVAEVA